MWEAHTSVRGRLGRILGALFLLGFAFAGFGAQPALAHNSLGSSNPVNGEVMAQSPSFWTLAFVKDVPLATASGEIVGNDGVRRTLASPIYGATKKEIVFTFPTALEGAITARWRLVGTDGHVITERVNFTVQATAVTVPSVVVPEVGITSTTILTQSVASVPAKTEITLTPESIRFGIRALGYAAILLVGGMLFTELFIAKGVLGAPRASTALFVGGGLLTLAPLLQVLIFLNDTRDFGVLGSLFHIGEALDTTAGSMFFARFIIGILICAGIYRAHRFDSQVLVSHTMLMASGMYLLALAYTGHSRSQAWPVLGVPVDVLHTLAAAVWLGGLAVLAIFVLPVLQPAQSFDAFRRFGDAAQYAVITLVVTGIIQTLRLHGTIFTLFTQSHGRWLLLKLALVAAMLKVGDVNRRRLMRKISSDDMALTRRVALLRRASVTELVSGGLVTLATTVLVSSSFS